MSDKTVYHIGYCGGSGGFLLLHLLLLSGQYHTRFCKNISFEKIIKEQWSIPNPLFWKNTEIWPNNTATMCDETNLNKLLYFCNPTPEDFFGDYGFVEFNNAYCNIKDATWPEIKSFVEFNNLPIWIQAEMLDRSGYKNLVSHVTAAKKYVWIYTDINSQNELAFYKKAFFYYQRPTKEKTAEKDLEKFAAPWKETFVHKKAIDFLNKTDIQIKLQHLVNHPEILIDCGLVTKINLRQFEFLAHWKHLHCPDLLHKIGIF
jgi:hypothetical protein